VKPATRNVEIVQGATWRQTFYLPFDLAGAAVSAGIRWDRPGRPDLLLTEAGGQVQVARNVNAKAELDAKIPAGRPKSTAPHYTRVDLVLDAATTESLRWTAGSWWFDVKFADGDTSRFFEGRVTVRAKVKQP
jgi:hypothetical protein